VEHIKLVMRSDPVVGPGEILVKMEAASVNYRDFVVTQRGYGRRSGDLPLIVLGDGAGTVVKLGPGVMRVAIGDLVCPIFAQNWLSGPMKEEHQEALLGGPLDGVMREFMVLHEQAVVKAPSHYSAIEAATLPCAALTAWHAVIGSGIKAGDVVLTQGTGGVSLFAMMFAKAMGALTIITSSSDEKLERARAHGADFTINYRTEPQWHREAREITGGRGVDLVVELAGTLDESVRAVRVGGTIALIGVLSGATAELKLGRVVTQNIRLQGITLGNRDMFEDMVRAIERHQLEPPIHKTHFNFEDVATAIQAITEGKHFGKICVTF
jgi:NADPH:quinone reductase-like Zn-dependent oxidoreductase